MSQGNDWYSSDSWYSVRTANDTGAGEAEKQEQSKTASRSEKTLAKPHRNGRIAGIIVIVLVLIAASSLAFGKFGLGKTEAVITDNNPGVSESDELPDSYRDFFKSYYSSYSSSSSASDETETSTIQKTDTLPFFTLQLQDNEEKELTLQELYRKCAKSVVEIRTYADGESGYYWGSGIIMSSEGLIVTNAHIIDGCSSASVTLFDERTYDALLVGEDSVNDIAVLKINETGLDAAEFGNSELLSVGDNVAAIGNPIGENYSFTLTNGIISAIDRDVIYDGHVMTLLQTNTAINNGNSGGALFNMYGQVVGITNMKLVSATGVEGIGFAIPSSVLKTVTEQLVTTGTATEKGTLGITCGNVPKQAVDQYGVPYGLYVSDVLETSDAYTAGVRAGDIITAVNGTEVKTTSDVMKIRDSHAIGDTLNLTIWRDGTVMDIGIKIMPAS